MKNNNMDASRANLEYIPAALQEHFLELHAGLSKTVDFAEFKHGVQQELNKLGLQSWYYTRLDLPNKISTTALIGNIDKKLLKRNLDEKLYHYDLTLQHARLSATPVFQSQFEAFIDEAPYTNQEFEQYRNLINLNRMLGHNDTYSIAIKSRFANGSALFATTSKGLEESSFRNIATEHTDLLTIIARAVDSVGTTLFPEQFIAAKKHYDELTSSFAFKLLATIAKKDFTNLEAAEYFGISNMDVERELANVRQMLGTRTNHGAYGKAKEAGYLSSF
jgi:hypothetical protein